MAITIGTQIGSHEITALLGKGGMGEVYRARDRRLKREVAIKILPEQFSKEADRMSRFQREAEVLASLNHPNIAAVYSLEEAAGSRYLVMELVEGETLADKFARGPIPLDEALNTAGHICDALGAAHERGVVHRDLKPANVKVTPDGKVKVLDFGLAKALDRSGNSASFDPSNSLPGGPAGNAGAQRSLVWVNRQGQEEPIKAPPRAYNTLRISPNGARVALDIFDQENDIWIWDLMGQTLTRLTFDPGVDQLPVWTPDSRRVLFTSPRGGSNTNLFWQAADNTGTAERLTTSPNWQGPMSVSPDGKSVVFVGDVTGTGLDLNLLTLDEKRTTAPLVNTSFREYDGEISPDGRWLAYESNESGQNQIYVRPFPNVDSGRWQVSTAGGTRPAWARSGKELFYVDSKESVLMGVPVQTGGQVFSAGAPAKVFDVKVFTGSNGRTYDVSPDGQRFLLIKDSVGSDQASTAKAAGMVVVLNWLEELKARTGS